MVPAEVLVTKSPKLLIDKRLSKMKKPTTKTESGSEKKSLWRRVKEVITPARQEKIVETVSKPIVKEVKVTKTKVVEVPKKPTKVTKTKIKTPPLLEVKTKKPPKTDKVEVKIVTPPQKPIKTDLNIITPKVQHTVADNPRKVTQSQPVEKAATQTIVFKPQIHCPTPQIPQQAQSQPCAPTHPVAQTPPAPVIVQPPPINIKQDPVIKALSKPGKAPLAMQAQPVPQVKTIALPQPMSQTVTEPTSLPKSQKKKRHGRKAKAFKASASSSSDDIHEAIWQELNSLNRKITTKHHQSRLTHGEGGPQYLNQTFPLVAPQPQYIAERTPARARLRSPRGHNVHRWGHPQKPITSGSFEPEAILPKIKPPKSFRNKGKKTAADKAKKAGKKKKRKGDPRLGKLYPISERGLYERLLNVGHPEPNKMPDQMARSQDLVEGDNPAPPWGDNVAGGDGE